jgi:hypothetical protein
MSARHAVRLNTSTAGATKASQATLKMTVRAPEEGEAAHVDDRVGQPSPEEDRRRGRRDGGGDPGSISSVALRTRRRATLAGKARFRGWRAVSGCCAVEL